MFISVMRCPTDDETPLYVQVDSSGQPIASAEPRRDRPLFAEWAWETTLMLQLVELMCPAPGANGVQVGRFN